MIKEIPDTMARGLPLAFPDRLIAPGLPPHTPSFDKGGRQPVRTARAMTHVGARPLAISVKDRAPTSFLRLPINFFPDIDDAANSRKHRSGALIFSPSQRPASGIGTILASVAPSFDPEFIHSTRTHATDTTVTTDSTAMAVSTTSTAFQPSVPLLAARRASRLTTSSRPSRRVSAPIRRAAMVTAAPPLPPQPLPSSGAVAEISSATDFVSLQAQSAALERVVYVLFHARFCRACKFVHPKFASLAEKYPHATFASVTLEDGRELASRLGVRSVPSVQVYQGAHGKVEEFPCGPTSLPRLREIVEELSPMPNPAI